jgi:hypothetical protein
MMRKTLKIKELVARLEGLESPTRCLERDGERIELADVSKRGVDDGNSLQPAQENN